MKFKRPARLQSLSLSVNLVSEGMQFLVDSCSGCACAVCALAV